MTTPARYAVVAVALLTACSTQSPRGVESKGGVEGTRGAVMPRAESKTPITVLLVRMEYSRDRIAGRALAWTRDTRLWLGLVRGAVFGNPSVTLHEETGNLRQFSLDLNALAASTGQYAEPLTAAALAQGFRIEPAETRIARVGTYNYDALTGAAIGGTAFIEPVDRGLLILIYVDRPCRLSGTVRVSETQSAELDALVPDAGFHWLRVLDEDPNHQRMISAHTLSAVTHLTLISP